jgi:hypothetical protein
MKFDTELIINAYTNGQSLNSIARSFGTYPTSIKRILKQNGIELRDDAIKKGSFTINDGDKLIEWAKAQKRLVTKTELAQVVGKARLSPSYFIKYPELGQYIQTREQNELQKYAQTLYNWLKENNIPYKPNDRSKLNVSVTALLLGDYSNVILQIAIKPRCISLKKYSENMLERKNRAHEKDMTILFIHEEDFKNLDSLKERLT